MTYEKKTHIHTERGGEREGMWPLYSGKQKGGDDGDSESKSKKEFTYVSFDVKMAKENNVLWRNVCIMPSYSLIKFAFYESG